MKVEHEAAVVDTANVYGGKVYGQVMYAFQVEDWCRRHEGRVVSVSDGQGGHSLWVVVDGQLFVKA